MSESEFEFLKGRCSPEVILSAQKSTLSYKKRKIASADVDVLPRGTRLSAVAEVARAAVVEAEVVAWLAPAVETVAVKGTAAAEEVSAAAAATTDEVVVMNAAGLSQRRHHEQRVSWHHEQRVSSAVPRLQGVHERLFAPNHRLAQRILRQRRL